MRSILRTACSGRHKAGEIDSQGRRLSRNAVGVKVTRGYLYMTHHSLVHLPEPLLFPCLRNGAVFWVCPISNQAQISSLTDGCTGVTTLAFARVVPNKASLEGRPPLRWGCASERGTPAQAHTASLTTSEVVGRGRLCPHCSLQLL